ncbi:hypothetical protein FSARC_1910 [Fusarium sarcochroum]|uniref:Uncharacterized protein n=1 Tax=Fusarium sarcochroum TaxID=1208366 RepID=A0A8H4U7G6_9HYPO|nr:hypothetical protein FSARC_1910 [Fusarium sarcochroum]
MVAFIKLATLAFGVAFAAASPTLHDDYCTDRYTVRPENNYASLPPTPNEVRSTPLDFEIVDPLQGPDEPSSSPNHDPDNLEPDIVSITKWDYEVRNVQWLRYVPISMPHQSLFTVGGSWISDVGKMKQMLNDGECRPIGVERTFDNGKDFGDGNLTIGYNPHCNMGHIVDAAIELTRLAQVEANLPQTPLVLYNCHHVSPNPHAIYIDNPAATKQK